MASRDWAIKKQAVRERSGGLCERGCGNPAAQVHHQTYANLYREPLEDLLHVCRPCHEFLSGETDVDPVTTQVRRILADPSPVRLADLDVTDRQLIEVLLNNPDVVGRLIARVAVSSVRDAPLRMILQVCYDLYGEGHTPTFERVSLRLDDPRVRALAAGLLLPLEVPLHRRLRSRIAWRACSPGWPNVRGGTG